MCEGKTIMKTDPPAMSFEAYRRLLLLRLPLRRTERRPGIHRRVRGASDVGPKP
jgi:hypothetical protein